VKRRLFNLAAAVSLVLCVATVVLWVKSYWQFTRASAYLPITQTDAMTYLERGQGVLSVHRFERLKDRPFDAAFSSVAASGPSRTTWSLAIDGSQHWAWGGFSIEWAHVPPMHQIVLVLPLWFLALLFALAPLLAARSRWRRCSPGTCRNCRYDLRATPDRCPECGVVSTPPAAAVTSSA
jgi:hypothetical protein